MGSPYCEHLQKGTGLRYAYSLNLNTGRPTTTAGFSIRLHLPDLTTRKDNYQPVNSVCFDTGAKHSAMGIAALNKILTRIYRPESLKTNKGAYTSQETWDWMANHQLRQVRVSSLVSKALAQGLKGQTGEVPAFVLPILISFPHRRSDFYRLNVRVVREESHKFLLSPRDVHHSFAVLVDYAPPDDVNNPCKIRFFETPESELRPLMQWKAIGALDDV